jgi:hypothetical protein
MAAAVLVVSKSDDCWIVLDDDIEEKIGDECSRDGRVHDVVDLLVGVCLDSSCVSRLLLPLRTLCTS